MDPIWVVGRAYNMAFYILDNIRPTKDGDTIDGAMDGQTAGSGPPAEVLL